MIIDEGYCNCTACGEEITIPIDASVGNEQCHEIECGGCGFNQRIRVEVEKSGDITVAVHRD